MSLLYIWTTTILLTAWLTNAQGKFRLLFDSCNITSLHSSLNINCSIVDEELMSVYFSVLEQYAAVYGNITVQMAYRGSYVTVLELNKANYCRLYATNAPALFGIFKDKRDKTKFFKIPQYCPYKVGDYYMKNLRISSENVPLNLPPLHFKATFTTYVPRKGETLKVLSGVLLGRVKKD